MNIKKLKTQLVLLKKNIYGKILVMIEEMEKEEEAVVSEKVSE